MKTTITKTILMMFVSLFAFAAFAAGENNPGMITLRVGPNGETSFVEGDGVPANGAANGELNWQNVTPENQSFGHLHFNRGRHPMPPRAYYPQQPYGYWGGGYYQNYYPPFYPNYYGYTATPYICGTWGIWPFVYYRYCW